MDRGQTDRQTIRGENPHIKLLLLLLLLLFTLYPRVTAPVRGYSQKQSVGSYARQDNTGPLFAPCGSLMHPYSLQKNITISEKVFITSTYCSLVGEDEISMEDEETAGGQSEYTKNDKAKCDVEFAD